MTPLSTELLRRFDVAGPRYTSYPTADRFVEAFGPADLAGALAQRRATGQSQPLSLYVHIPFCESLCNYCACNKIITRKHDRAAAYLRNLQQEVALYAQHLGTDRPVSQLHLGGGTPTFLTDAELGKLMDILRRGFRLMPGGEYSIEVDPPLPDPYGAVSQVRDILLANM